MNTLQLLRRIVALDGRDLSALDEPMLTALAELPAHAAAILKAIDSASNACASLENVVHHLGEHMTPSDRIARDRVAGELLQSLQALDGAPGQALH